MNSQGVGSQFSEVFPHQEVEDGILVVVCSLLLVASLINQFLKDLDLPFQKPLFKL